MRRRSECAQRAQDPADAAAARQDREQRRAIRDSLRRGYREMGRLNLTLAEEGLVFEHVGDGAPGQWVRQAGST